MISSQFTLANLKLLCKYAAVSVLGYSTILLLMFFLVDVLGIDKLLSFICIYCIAYLAVYFINLKLLFVKEHSWGKVVKFILHTLFFLVCASFIFSGLIRLEINYLWATLLTAGILMPVRFLASKLIVFK